MDERLIRGSVALGADAYLVERCDRSKVKSRALGSATKDKVNRGGWYPMDLTVSAYKAVAETHDDPMAAYRDLVECGKFIGHEATTGFLRLLVKFLTPAVFARKFPEFWRKDHNFGQVTVDRSEFEKKRLVIQLDDVDGYEHIGPVCSGWIQCAFESMGVPGVTVTEKDRDLTKATSPQYRFQLAWA